MIICKLTRSEERQSVIMLPYSIFSFNNFDIINFDVCGNLIKITVIGLQALLC